MKHFVKQDFSGRTSDNTLCIVSRVLAWPVAAGVLTVAANFEVEV